MYRAQMRKLSLSWSLGGGETADKMFTPLNSKKKLYLSFM